MTQTKETEITVLDYNELIDLSVNLNDRIARAFGSDAGCLGVLFVKNVPNLAPKRQKLLRTASVFAALPDKLKETVVHEQSSYLQGWSHGKEIMNGKIDFAKGSYYNNPMSDIPPTDDPSYIDKHPEYGHPNVWPKELPQLREEFMDLGDLIVKVGKLVAQHCDKYMFEKHPDIGPNFLQTAIEKSINCKARLLHYFPMKKEDILPTPDGRQDSWCGLHVDHSLLTGLTSAMYIDESNDLYMEVDKSIPAVKDALESAGLYIQSRGDQFVQVIHLIQAKVPADYIAFQLGEATQIASRGLFRATPHLVRGASYPNLARNTFAVFMQANVDYKLTPELTFDQFTKQVMKRHYAPVS